MKRRRDALNAPQQMIFRFLLFSQPKNGPPSYNFPPSLSRHVTPSEGGKPPPPKGKWRPCDDWMEQQAVQVSAPNPTFLPPSSVNFFLSLSGRGIF